MLRHPLLVAQSICSNGWGVTNNTFLNNKSFVDRALNDEPYRYAINVNANGTLLEKHLLNWFFDNKLVVENAPNYSIVFRYEDLISQPLKIAENLKKVIPELSTNNFVNALQKPSKSSRFSQDLKHVTKVDNSFIDDKINKVKAKYSKKELVTFSELQMLFPKLKSFYD